VTGRKEKHRLFKTFACHKDRSDLNRNITFDTHKELFKSFRFFLLRGVYFPATRAPKTTIAAMPNTSIPSLEAIESVEVGLPVAAAPVPVASPLLEVVGAPCDPSAPDVPHTSLKALIAVSSFCPQ
jgi:hypothetical protein